MLERVSGCLTDSAFRNSGLERVASLDQDIAWMAAEYDLAVPELGDENPADIYSQYLLFVAMSGLIVFSVDFLKI